MTTSRYRVLQLGSPTGLYGAERWILALIRHLDPLEVESIVAVIRDEPHLMAPLCTEAESSGFEAHIIDALGKVNWSAVKKLRQLLIDKNIHVLHSHGYKTDLVGLLAVRGTSCRLITTPHGWSTQAGWKLRFYEALDRAVFPFFDAVIPLSDALHDELLVAPGVKKKLGLIRNGVDISEIDATLEIAAEARRWKQTDDFVIGYIGQLIPRKGLDVLMEAFVRLDVPGKRLVLLGDGPQREELGVLAEKLGIGQRVNFLGFREDRLSFLKAFDVFALPSRLEGIPRCLMESMAARVPIVATDIPGCADLIKHEETGLLFPKDNVDLLVSSLKRLKDPELRTGLADRGREHVLKYYSANAMAHQYQMLFRSLVASHG